MSNIFVDKNTYGARLHPMELNEYLAKHFDGSLSAFARKVGMSRQYISMLAKREFYASKGRAEKISRGTGGLVQADRLMADSVRAGKYLSDMVRLHGVVVCVLFFKDGRLTIEPRGDD